MKERYTLLVLSLLLVVMLYGITSVLGASNWTVPTENFPSAGSIKAPIDVGAVEQKREGIITFETTSTVATTSLDITNKNLSVGDASSSNFFAPYTTGGPTFFSPAPITISADGHGLVLPNIANPDGDPDTKVPGNLIFDSTAKKLKLFVNNAWKTIEGAASLWAKDASGDISYTNGPVTINNADLVVTGDIEIKETQPKYYYYPEFGSSDFFISDDSTSEPFKHKFAIEAMTRELSSYKRLPCDVSTSTLDCLFIKPSPYSYFAEPKFDQFFSASASDPEETVDVAYFYHKTNSSVVADGAYVMKYKKWPYEYRYNPPSPLSYESIGNSTLPHIFWNIQYGSNGSVYLLSDFQNFAPPPESGWPAEVYDWTLDLSNKPTVAMKYTRVPLTREQLGFERDIISFPTNLVYSTSSAHTESNSNSNYNASAATFTQNLGYHSFCTLEKFTVNGKYGRGACDVFYDTNEETWKLFSSAWVRSVDCEAICF
jgi:hypothetical protein